MVTVCPSQFATRRTLFHVLVGCGLLMLKVSRLKLPVIWLLVSMWLNTLTKSQIWTLRSEERRVGKECRSSGDSQERINNRHHDYDQCLQSVQLLQWNSQVKFNVTVYRNLPTTRDSIMTLLFFKQKTAYELGLGIPAEPLFRSWLLVSMWLNTLTKSQIWTL